MLLRNQVFCVTVIMYAFTIESLAGKQRSRRDRAERGRRSGGVDANGMPIAPGDGLEEGEEVDMDENVHCVNGYCIDRKYNKLELPSAGKTHVRMNLEVLDVLRVDDKQFSVAIDMYFGVHWTERRLKLPTFQNGSTQHANWLPIDLNFMNHLWVPNVFVYNLASFEALNCLEKLAGLWIVNHKNLFYNQATHVTFMCPMRFNKFPLDEHTCKFKVGSSNYDETRMTFSNEKLSYDPGAGNTILDYQVVIKELKPEDRILPYAEAGNYSITGFEMTLTRNVAKYLYIYYLPSGLFVVVSWVSFLIPPEVVPGRMALLVTLFLVLTNIFNTITNVSPNVEGMTAIASWMIACMFFVFLALLEYATILYFQLIRRKFQLVKKRKNLTVIHNKDCFLYQGSELNKRKDEISGIEQSQRLAKTDTIFMYVFPVTFIVFNVFYWPFWANYVPS